MPLKRGLVLKMYKTLQCGSCDAPALFFVREQTALSAVLWLNGSCLKESGFQEPFAQLSSYHRGDGKLDQIHGNERDDA